MMFDVTLRVGEPVVQVLQDENSGKSYELHYIAPVFSLLPTPQGAMQIQSGVLRLPMTKDMVEAAIGVLTEGLEGLSDAPGQSDLVVPGNMNEAEQMAAQIRQAQGGNGPGR